MVTRTAGRRRPARARRASRGAASSPVISWLARAGLAARGVLYALIGVIAIEIAFGATRQQADRTGAVRLVASTPFGKLLLWLLAAGFAGMALWRLSEAVWGAAGPGGHKTSARLSALGRAVVYGVITYGILKYALGLGAPASSDKQSQDLTATALRYPGGQAAVAVVGAAVVVAGVVMMYRSWQGRFLQTLSFGRASARTRRIVTRLGQIGGVARGAVFVCIGIFLAIAAIDASPKQAKGVDSALRAFAQTPLGPWLLVLVAAGLVTFGVFSCCEARWRRV
jgi:Domain of Unknown Function (DUF1206)